MQLADASDLIYEAEHTLHKSGCIETYFQTGVQTTRNNVLLDLVAHILQEPASDILRTKEQLGYIVFTGVRRTNGVQGFRIIVQSTRHPIYLNERVEAFLKTMKSTLENMDEEEFKTHVEALAVSKLEKPKSLSELSSRFWCEIMIQEYNFDRRNTDVAMLRTLTKQDVMEFFSQFEENSPSRHKLSIHIVSSVDKGPEAIEETELKPSTAERIVNITQFKASHSLYPLGTAVIDFQSHSTKSKL